MFREYIVEIIPDCVSKLEFDGDRLNSVYKELNKIMMQMIRDSKYYAYAKRDFYLELQQMTMDLEDKLMECATKRVSDRDEQVQLNRKAKKRRKGFAVLFIKVY